MTTPAGRSAPWIAFLALFTVWACGGEPAPNPIRDAFAAELPPATSGPPVAFRFPNRGTTVRLHRLPGLDEVAWHFTTGTLSSPQVIGYSAADDQIFIHTADSALLALDLAGGRTRIIDSMTVLATMDPINVPLVVRADLVAGLVRDRRLEPWPDTLVSMPSRIWGTTRNRLVAVRDSAGARAVSIYNPREHEADLTLPAGPMAVTRWGDFVAVATDSGVLGIHLLEDTPVLRFSNQVPVGALAFSASGHRLYLAERSVLRVLDRFTFAPLDSLLLPTATTALRTDPLGRYLYVRAGADSVLILDITRGAVVTIRSAPWAADLPTATDDGSILSRDGGEVVVLDPTGRERGRLHGARDTWTVLPWDPRRPALQLAVDAGQDVADAGERTFYAQLASTSNLEWATERVNDLRSAGLKARVVMPSEFEDRYRVVLGPFPTRDEADASARVLGQAYFIISFSQQDTTITFR